jgi:two-component system sensor histidine kinase GlrK
VDEISKMKLTIFSRLVIGYLIIFVLVIAMSIYAVVRIGQFNKVTQSVLMTNSRMTDYAGKLIDATLSQVRYEKKFIISKDKAFYKEFLSFKNEFDLYFGQAMLIADSSQMENILNAVKGSYQTYQSVLGEEIKYLQSHSPYSPQYYTQEKEKASNAIIEQLEKLKIYVQQNTNDKLGRLYEAGREARKMAIIMTGVFLLLGVSISFFINRSITQPISLLMKKTRDIARGDFNENLDLSSPPELAELANAFNLMCSKLNELDKMKSNFFSTMAHELRTPLSSIKMGISLFVEGREGPITESQKELLLLLKGENERLITLINSLLDLAKMEAGMMAYRFEQKNLTPLIDQVVKEIGPIIEGKKIILESKGTERLPLVKMDGERILQALRNIIGNAIKFTPEGGRVSVLARTVDQGVEVSVSDTGPGIPEESLASIFEKFKQARPKGTYKNKGTGLGLAIAKQIVTSHGGKIWAESKLGQGSTFFVVLPV